MICEGSPDLIRAWKIWRVNSFFGRMSLKLGVTHSGVKKIGKKNTSIQLDSMSHKQEDYYYYYL